jgi:hypothetical protein
MSVPSPNITMKPEPRPSLLHRNPDATDRSRILVQDLTLAVARVELIGTAAARTGAEAVYDESVAIGHMYAHFESQRTDAEKKRRTHVFSEADSDNASTAIRKLEAQIQSFLELARREQGN